MADLLSLYGFSKKHGGFDLYKEWKKLLESGHDPNEDWVNHWNLREFDCRRTSPLFAAALDRRIDLINVLLDHGANLDRHNAEGRTILQEAILARHEKFRHETFRLLLDRGANFETEIASGYLEGGTALHIAAAEGCVEHIELLLQRGANPKAKTRKGWTAVDIAMLDAQESLLAILLESMDLPTGLLEAFNLDQDSEQIEDGNQSDAARHLIEHSLRGAKTKHRKLYEHCIREIVKSHDGSDTLDDSQLAKSLIRELNTMLMELAGSPGEITWSRGLCSQCERFQSQDGCKAFEVFEHSADRMALLKSAQQGCTLCSLIDSCLNQQWCLLKHVDSKWRNEFGIKPTVRLRLGHKTGGQYDMFGRYQLIIVCDEHTALIDMDHVQTQINAAVAKTPSSDVEGTGSDRSLAVAAAWLDRCFEEHPSCHAIKESRLPTRVLDVGDEQNLPRIYITNKEEARYAVISLHPGVEQDCRALTTIINAYTEGIPLELLSKSVLDAVLITRKLGLRYLWSDVLCILQDCKDDIKTEIDRVADTYSNSYLTIMKKPSFSAADEGLFYTRTWPTTAIYPLDIRLASGYHQQDSSLHGRTKNARTSSMNRIMVLRSHHQFKESEDNPILDTKTWALQETIFPRRVLKCGEGELSWECLEGKCSERIPEEDDVRNISWIPSIRRAIAFGLADHPNRYNPGPDGLFDKWLDMVSAITKGNVTEPRQTFAAVSSVQESIGKLIDDIPVAGMWKKQYFTPSLLWQAADQKSLPHGIVRESKWPSWSWIAHPGPVSHRVKPQHGKSASTSWYHETIHFPKVLSWNDQEEDSGAGEQGCVSLRCRLIPDSKLSSKDKENLQFQVHHDFSGAESIEDVWSMIIQTSQFVPKPEPFGARKYDIDTVMLRLERIDKGKMTFRRIGLITCKSAGVKWHDRGKDENFLLF